MEDSKCGLPLEVNSFDLSNFIFFSNSNFVELVVKTLFFL